MKTITLTKIIQNECKDPTFNEHFQRELLINEIAKMVIELRHNAKLTQHALADRAGTTQPVIARLESGNNSRVPSLELLTRLASATHTHLRIVLDSK